MYICNNYYPMVGISNILSLVNNIMYIYMYIAEDDSGSIKK